MSVLNLFIFVSFVVFTLAPNKIYVFAICGILIGHGWSYLNDRILSTTKIKSFQNGLSCQTHSLVIPDIDFFHTNLKPKHICPTALFERNKTQKIYTFTCSFLTLNSCCVLSPRSLFNRSICLCRASFSSVNLFCVNYNTTFKGYK